jgi:hypothetical protein
MVTIKGAAKLNICIGKSNETTKTLLFVLLGRKMNSNFCFKIFE